MTSFGEDEGFAIRQNSSEVWYIFTEALQETDNISHEVLKTQTINWSEKETNKSSLKIILSLIIIYLHWRLHQCHRFKDFGFQNNSRKEEPRANAICIHICIKMLIDGTGETAQMVWWLF